MPATKLKVGSNQYRQVPQDTPPPPPAAAAGHAAQAANAPAFAQPAAQAPVWHDVPDGDGAAWSYNDDGSLTVAFDDQPFVEDGGHPDGGVETDGHFTVDLDPTDDPSRWQASLKLDQGPVGTTMDTQRWDVHVPPGSDAADHVPTVLADARAQLDLGVVTADYDDLY